MVRFWRDKLELQAQFAISLGTTITISPRRGWVRAPEASDVDVVQALSKLTEENARLRKEVETLRLEGRAPDDLDPAVQHLRRHGVASGRGHIPGITAFTAISQAIGGRVASITRIAREMGETLDYGDVHEQELEQFLTELAVCGLCGSTTSASGVRWHMTELGKRVYIRSASDATVEQC